MGVAGGDEIDENPAGPRVETGRGRRIRGIREQLHGRTDVDLQIDAVAERDGSAEPGSGRRRDDDDAAAGRDRRVDRLLKRRGVVGRAVGHRAVVRDGEGRRRDFWQLRRRRTRGRDRRQLGGVAHGRAGGVRNGDRVDTGVLPRHAVNPQDRRSRTA